MIVLLLAPAAMIADDAVEVDVDEGSRLLILPCFNDGRCFASMFLIKAFRRILLFVFDGGCGIVLLGLLIILYARNR